MTLRKYTCLAQATTTFSYDYEQLYHVEKIAHAANMGFAASVAGRC